MTDRRRWLQLTAAAAAAWTLRGFAPDAQASAPKQPLRILILGGTGFIGPHQVRYALSRGHTLTLFNRGRRTKEWPGEVEELHGDRNTGDLAALTIDAQDASAPGVGRDLRERQGVRRVRAADDDHRVRYARDLGERRLPIRGRETEVMTRGGPHLGELLAGAIEDA